MILGLDMALLTGWAVSEKGHVKASGVWDFSKTRTARRHNGHLFNAFVEGVCDAIRVHRVDAVFYERPHHRGGPATRLALGFSSHVLSLCARAELPVYDVHTSTLKLWAVGNGRAGKDEMIRYAARALLREPQDDNEADAVCVALYGDAHPHKGLASVSGNKEDV
jgi:Holliday junction resolvasome RuvABC endonuclease subunit